MTAKELEQQLAEAKKQELKEKWEPKREFKPCILCGNKMIAKGLCRRHYNIEYNKTYKLKNNVENV